MKRIRKRIGSLLISVCMVFALLPTPAFAAEGVPNSGTPSSASEITGFDKLADNVALQKVESGTTVDALNLPGTLTVTVTTGSTITANVSGDEASPDSDALNTKTQEETTVVVSEWTAVPAYDGNTEGDYTFTPTLDIIGEITVAVDVMPPQITVTVKEPATPMLRGAGTQLLGTGNDITNKFTDPNFLAKVRTALSKAPNDPIYDTDDFASVKSLIISRKNITSLAGIEYFTALTELNCDNNNLTALNVSKKH